MTVTVELRQPGEGPALLRLAGPVEVGREGDGIRVRDTLVSRRHALLTPTDEGLRVEDLGSTHGTLLDGVPIKGTVVARPGQTVGIGLCDLRVTGVQPSRRPAAAAGPGLGDLSQLTVDGGVVGFRPGTAGQRFAPRVAAALGDAHEWLEGLLGDQTPDVAVRLLDPFPHPREPSTIVADGAVVEGATIWQVATPEVPPTGLRRWMGLVAATHLPAGTELAWLLEGLGHLDDGHDPTTGEPAGALDGTDVAASASFAAFLRQLGGDESVVRLATTAQPGRVDAAAEAVFGETLAKLEQRWRKAQSEPGSSVSVVAFVKLAWRYLAPYRVKEAESLLHTLLGLAFTLAFPFVFRALIDEAIPAADFGQIGTLLAILGVAFAVSVGGQVRRSYLAGDVSGRIAQTLRANLFGRLQVLSRAWHDRQDPGDLLSRFFSDVGQLEAGLSAVVRDGVVNVVSLGVAAVVLLVLQPLLGAIVLLGAPVVAVVYRRMSSSALERSTRVQEAAGAVLGVARENQEAREVVTAYGLADREASRFHVVAERLRKAELGLNLFTGLFSLSVSSILIVLRLVVLGLGAWLITRDQLTLGGLVAFVSVMNEVLEPAATLSQVGQRVQTSGSSLARINEVLDARVDIAAPSDPVAVPSLADALTLTDVTFSYPGSPPVLRDLTCAIPAGSRVAFVGPSGAGKSSVLRLLTREYDPQEGEVAIDGTALPRMDPAALRSRAAVVFQRTFLFDTTIRENVRLGRPEATDAEVDAAVAAAQLDPTAFPDGLDTLVGQDGARVSGGQGQRLAIARALIRDPSLLILDEATSSLDAGTERALSATLADVARGRTVVAVTHRLTTVTDYDRIFVLVAGRLAEQGTHDELRAAGGVYARLWAEQSGEPVETARPFDVATAIAAHPLFAGLSSEEVGAVAEALRPLSLATDAELREQPGMLAFVADGAAEVVVPGGDGRMATSTVLDPGEVFGVAGLSGETHGAILRAREPTELLVLEPAAGDRLSRANPAIAHALRGAPEPVGPDAGIVRSATN